MKRFFATLTVVVLLGSILITTVPVAAADVTCTWTGGGGDNKFSTSANWSGCGGAPTNGVDLVFDRAGLSSGVSIENDLPNLTTDTIHNVDSSNNQGYYQEHFTITGTNTLTITGGIIGDALFAVTAPMSLGADANINGRWVSLGGISLNGHNLTVDGFLINNDIVSGQGNIIVNGSIFFNSNNTWAGSLTVNNRGSADIASSDPSKALGAAFNNVTVKPGGMLNICMPNGASIPQNMTLGGDKTTIQLNISSCSMKGRSLTESEGAVTFTGQLTLTADAWIFTSGSTTFTKSIFPTHTLHLADGSVPNSLHVSYSDPDALSDSGDTSTITTLSDNQPDVNVSILGNTTVVIDGARGAVTVDGGTLKGTGTIGALRVNSGIVAPGHSPGTLNTGNLTFVSGQYQVEIGGTATGQYDQMNVNGTVDLASGGTNTTLVVSQWNGYRPKVGDSFIIINNDGVDVVNATFKNLPEGSVVAVGGIIYKITYKGGDGNDVALTVATSVTVPNTGYMLTNTYPFQTLIVTMVSAAALALLAARTRKTA